MRHWFHWITDQPRQGDTPDAFFAVTLTAAGLAGAAIVYFRLRAPVHGFLAYGLAWVGVVGLMRLYEALGGADGRFLSALVEGAFLLTYGLAGLDLLEMGDGAMALRWTIKGLLLLAAGAGGVLILAALGERYRR